MGPFISYVLPAVPAVLTCIGIQEYGYQIWFKMLNIFQLLFLSISLMHT